MLTRLDHLVILVRDLDRAIRGYEALGFAVTPGGEHADGLTRNALIPFKDGSYLELVAFVDPEDSRDNVWGWRRFLSSGGGLIDYCAASDDLAADVRRLGERDFAVDGPADGGRRLPDGGEIRWFIARIRQEGRLLPFLIEDLTPRNLRVPGGSSAEHPNGALGIRNLEIAAPDAQGVLRALATLTGSSGGPGTSLRLGSCLLSVVTLEQEDDVRHRLDATGPDRLPWGSRQTCLGARRSWTGSSPKGLASGSWGGQPGLKPSSPAHDKFWRYSLRRSGGLERDRANMEYTADALFVYDPEGRIFDVIRRACDTLGYTREELLSLSITDVETVLRPGGLATLWRRLAPDEPVSAERTTTRRSG